MRKTKINISCVMRRCAADECRAQGQLKGTEGDEEHNALLRDTRCYSLLSAARDRLQNRICPRVDTLSG